MDMRPLLGGLFVLLLATAACRDGDPTPTAIAAPATAVAPPPPAIEPVPAAPAAEAAPPRVERLAVEGDVPAVVVRGPGGALPRILFLPGVCSNAEGYLAAFPEAARDHGGVLAIDGDQACAPGFRSFSWDPIKQDARFRAALAAAGVTDTDAGGFTLVGYSSGADIGQLMVQRWPDRYTKVVLIGAPSDPNPARVAHADAVVTMSCSRDVTWRMKDAAHRIQQAGVPAEYLEMPGCTHGNVTDGDRLFGEAFDFLDAHARAR